MTLREARDAAETKYLAELLDRADGNMSKAARLGGVDRVTLYRVMRRLGVPRRARTQRGAR